MKHITFKQMLALLLTLVLTLSLAACAVGGADPTNGSTKGEEQEPAGKTVYVMAEREYKNFAGDGYTQTTVYTYGDDGQLVSVNQNGSEFTVVYKDGVAESVLYDGVSIFQFSWDNNGNLLEYTVTYGQGEDAESTTTRKEYDGNGNLIRQMFVNGDGEVETSTSYTYEDGLLVREEIFMGKIQEPGWIRIYTYDDNGNLIRMEEDGNYNERNGDITEYTYTYDDQGNLLTEEAVCEEEKSVTTFDTHGNILSLKVYKSDDLVREYAYTYEAVTAKETIGKMNATIVDVVS